MKALVSRFSRALDYLWDFFRLRSNSNYFLSFLLEIHIFLIFFLCVNFSSLLWLSLCLVVKYFFLRTCLFLICIRRVIFTNRALLPSLCLLIRTFYNSSKKMPRKVLLERCLHLFIRTHFLGTLRLILLKH